jgi:3-deoxy-D-arabino-heptulosonate 7-phosphate (DAHP) synthase
MGAEDAAARALLVGLLVAAAVAAGAEGVVGLAATTAERARHEAAGQLLQSGVEALLARVRPRPRPVVPPRVRLVGRLAL